MKGLKLLLLTFATLAITACSDDTTDEWHGDFGSIQVPDTRQALPEDPRRTNRREFGNFLFDERCLEFRHHGRIPRRSPDVGTHKSRSRRCGRRLRHPRRNGSQHRRRIPHGLYRNHLRHELDSHHHHPVGEPMERIPMNRTNPTSENRFGIGNCTRSSGATLREV